MRISYLTTDYPAYLSSFYQLRPELRKATFSVQHAALFTDGFGWHGAWTAAFAKLGHEVQEIYANVKPLQKAWSNENGGSKHSLNAIALSQLKQWNTELILIDDLATFSAEFLAMTRSQCPNLKLIIGFSGSISYNVDTVRSCDLLMSNIRSVALKFQKDGIDARYFPHAFNQRILAELPAREPVDDTIIFVGGLVRAAGYHLLRERLLEEIVQALPLRLYSSQADLTQFRDIVQTGSRTTLYYFLRTLHALGCSPERLVRIPIVGRASKWKHAPMRQINPLLQSKMLPALYGRKFYAAQRSSAVTLNIHGDNALDEAVNMRLFEVTGVGGCLLTDKKSNLGQFFEIDREVVSYASAEECIEKARWLLANPTQREAIARAGQKRTLAAHTFDHRAEELNSIIKINLAH